MSAPPVWNNSSSLIKSHVSARPPLERARSLPTSMQWTADVQTGGSVRVSHMPYLEYLSPRPTGSLILSDWKNTSLQTGHTFARCFDGGGRRRALPPPPKNR